MIGAPKNRFAELDEILDHAIKNQHEMTIYDLVIAVRSQLFLLEAEWKTSALYMGLTAKEWHDVKNYRGENDR